MTARDIADLFADLELRLIQSLKRNLRRHKDQEKAEGGKDGVPESWPAWQAEKLRNLNKFRQQNQKIVDEFSSRIDNETRTMLEEQFAEADGSEQAFFGVNSDKVGALIDEMTATEADVQKAALRYMDDVYRRTILRADAALTAGGVTMQQAVDLAVKDFLVQGITCIRYKNGRRVNIATYAEMALRTSNTRAMLLGEAQKRERMGIDTVLVSQYGACSDTCLPWQGLVYIDDVWQPYRGEHTPGGSYGVSRNGRSYMLLSVAVKAGLFHPNCRHTVGTWIEGVSRRPKPMDKAKIEAVNKLEAKQRRMELRVREDKRLVEGTQDPDQVKAYKDTLRRDQKALRDFVNEHGDVLRRDRWRERNDGTAYQTNAADVTKQGHILYSVTKEAIEAVPKPFFRSLSDRMNTQARTYAREILTSVKALPEGTEATISFSLDGTSVKRMVGDSGNGRVRIQDMAERYISLHNHASNDMLSPEDISALLNKENMVGIGAVGNRGAFFSCEKVYGYNQEKALALYDKIRLKYDLSVVEQRIAFVQEFEKEAFAYGLKFSESR